MWRELGVLPGGAPLSSEHRTTSAQPRPTRRAAAPTPENITGRRAGSSWQPLWQPVQEAPPTRTQLVVHDVPGVSHGRHGTAQRQRRPIGRSAAGRHVVDEPPGDPPAELAIVLVCRTKTCQPGSTPGSATAFPAMLCGGAQKRERLVHHPRGQCREYPSSTTARGQVVRTRRGYQRTTGQPFHHRCHLSS